MWSSRIIQTLSTILLISQIKTKKNFIVLIVNLYVYVDKYNRRIGWNRDENYLVWKLMHVFTKVKHLVSKCQRWTMQRLGSLELGFKNLQLLISYGSIQMSICFINSFRKVNWTVQKQILFLLKNSVINALSLNGPFLLSISKWLSFLVCLFPFSVFFKVTI